MKYLTVLLAVGFCLTGCGREHSKDLKVTDPSNRCIEIALQHVPLGTTREKATATLESLGLSCIYRKGSPTSDGHKTWLQDTLLTDVARADSIFSDSRYVPTLYLKNDVVVEIRRTLRRNISPSNRVPVTD